MENSEFEKSKTFIINEMPEYVSNSVVMRTILRKITGNVTAISLDSGQNLTEKISPFDTFIQVIDGKGDICINDKTITLDAGQCIIIPAHSRNTFHANVRFKMLSTTI